MKRKQFIVLITVLILLGMSYFLFGIKSVHADESNIYYDFYNEVLYDDNLPEGVSNWNIRNTTINTGNYNATYNFQNEALDTTGLSIDFVDTDLSGSGCQAIIKKTIQHNHTLKLEDTHATYSASVENDFSTPQSCGTFEYYVMSEDVSGNAFNMFLMDSGSANFRLRQASNKFQWYDGSYNDITEITPENDKWYHFEIDFEFTSGGYKGLSADCWNWYINGLLVLENEGFHVVGDDADGIRTMTASTAQNSWIDAIGYSWNGYNINDNYYPEIYTSNITESDKNEFAFDDSGIRITDDSDIVDFEVKKEDGDFMYIEVDSEDSIDNIIHFIPEATNNNNSLSYDLSAYNDIDLINVSFKFKYDYGNTNCFHDFIFYGSDGNTKLSFVIYNNFGTHSYLYYSLITPNLDSYTIGDFVLLNNSIPIYSNIYQNLTISCKYNSFAIFLNDYTYIINTSNSGFTDFDMNYRVVGVGSPTYWTECYLDYIQLYINYNSTSTEYLPPNIYLLGIDWNSHNHPFLNITFNTAYTNNLSIDICSESLLDGVYNSYYNNIYDMDFDYPSVYLIINNNTNSWNISNIKINGLYMSDGVNNYYPTLDYSNVDLNSSYFYALNEKLYYTITTNDSNTEYLQLNFDINNFVATGCFMSISSYKSNNYFYSIYELDYSDTSLESIIFQNQYDSQYRDLSDLIQVDSLSFIITDNDEINTNSSCLGYFSELSFEFSITLFDFDYTDLFGILPIYAIWLFITLLGYIELKRESSKDKEEMAYKIIIPLSMISLFLCFVSTLIPLWTLGVNMLAHIFIILKKRGL